MLLYKSISRLLKNTYAMTEILNKHSSPYFWRYDAECFQQVHADLFKGEYWQTQDAVIGQETGRGTTWFVRHQDHELVLRHYLRGGLVRHISRDAYFFNGLERTRAFAEFSILQTLHAQGFPVPKPAAAQIQKRVLWYQADLLTHKIPKAKDLVQVLKNAQDIEFYQRLGALIARFHQAGVYHADLNIQNILQDKEQQFWLIDFDRARILPVAQKWQLSTLNRLKRSFEKERSRHGIHWQDRDWTLLLEGYHKAMQGSV